jgi:hypothetical protein
MKHLRGFSRDDEGISGAVTATLVIATLTLVFTGVYTIVVPAWVDIAETNHMHQVANDLTVLKKNIQTQIVSGDQPLTMSSPITLKPDPTNNWLGVSGTTFPGVLTVDPSSERFNLTNELNPYEVYGACQGAVYFVPKNQEYANGASMRFIYSNGAVLKVQVKDGVMVAGPEFNLVNDTGNRTLYFSTISLFGQATSISGSKSVTVQTRALNGLVATYEGGNWATGVNVTINMTSTLGYAKTYKTFYEERLKGLGYNLGTDYTSSIIGDKVLVSIKKVNKVVLYTGTIEITLK